MTVPSFGIFAKKKICIICEGFEEKEYLERLQSFGAWSNQYFEVQLVNAKSISNIAPRYQDIFMSGSYDLILIFCDTDCYPFDGYNEMKQKIDKFHGRAGVAPLIVFFANPCVLQIIVLHFSEDIRLTSNQKSKNGKILEELVGIKNYQAHENQRAKLFEKINKQNFKQMLSRIGSLSDDETKENSTNFSTLINNLNSKSTKWIERINKKIFGTR